MILSRMAWEDWWIFWKWLLEDWVMRNWLLEEGLLVEWYVVRNKLEFLFMGFFSIFGYISNCIMNHTKMPLGYG